MKKGQWFTNLLNPAIVMGLLWVAISGGLFNGLNLTSLNPLVFVAVILFLGVMIKGSMR